MIKINLIINTIKPLLYIVSLVVIVYLFLQYVGFKNILGSGHWGKICSQDMVKNGKIISISAIAFLDKDNCPDGYKVIEVWVKDNTGKRQLTKDTKITSEKVTATPSPTLTPIPVPKYSVTVLNAPNVNNGAFDINVSVKNISVQPFITNFAFYECSFRDDKNNSYQGRVYTQEYQFGKGLLTGEGANITLKTTGASTEGAGGVSYLKSEFQKCGYDNSGNNVCVPITGMKILSCTAYITTDGKQSGNGWGKMPLKVEFPN